MTTEQRPAWEPSRDLVDRARITGFIDWLSRERNLHFDDFHELQRWSVTDVEAFWLAIWDFFDVQADGEPIPALASQRMPGAEWFPNAALNYAEQVFHDKDADQVAIFHSSEVRELGELKWGELRRQVAAVAAVLRDLGVRRGDRVAAYCPNIPEAVVACLAATSLGAIWSSSSPDFGASSVIDRFAQIEPKVLFAVDGYRYGGKDFDRRDVVAELRAGLPSLECTVLISYLEPERDAGPAAEVLPWTEVLARGAGADLTFERVPFGDPLWILYSSGTTGLPKAIVHSHGGILLEHLKMLNLQVDAHAGDRLFWFTTTGWMMWNFLLSGLLTPAAIVLYDGNPGHPDLGTLWRLAARTGVTMFGTSASYISACSKADIEPRADLDLGSLKAVGSTGSPLTPEGFDWVYDRLGSDTWLFSTSGGTDVCTAFIGGVPTLPVYRGELQAPALGAAVEAWDEEGNSVIGEVGELVITKPMPSMPVFFWGDDDGTRYRDSYFDMFPGVWRHGDWLEITARGTGIIYGRSDSTINRGGIRMGTSEIYRAVLSLDQIVDALVVDIPRSGTEGWMPLFVVLRDGVELDEELSAEIRRRVREQCSPRHVPDQVLEVSEVPRTLSGKVLEVPVKRILMGMPYERAVSRDALANPDALDFFIEMADDFGSPGEPGSS